MSIRETLKNLRLSIHAVGVAAAGDGVDWAHEAVDAAILAGITFFASLGGATAVDVPTVKAVIAAGIAAGSQFFVVLGLKRGLVKQEVSS